MNESRLKRIMQVMPAGFGMSYADWINLYSIRSLRWMVHENPAEWEAGRIVNVNRMARYDMAMIDHLMSMKCDDFETALAHIAEQMKPMKSRQ